MSRMNLMAMTQFIATVCVTAGSTAAVPDSLSLVSKRSARVMTPSFALVVVLFVIKLKSTC